MGGSGRWVILAVDCLGGAPDAGRAARWPRIRAVV